MLERAGYFIGYTGKGWAPGIWEVNQIEGNANTKNPAGYAYNEIKKKPPYKGINSIDYAANFEVFLRAKPKDKPFCFWLGTKEPHRGYGKDNWKLDGRNLADVTVPDYLPDNEIIRGDLADYAIEVEWYDTHIGRALEHLEKAGLLDNTLVIATSDHGMPFPRVKGQIYDDAFHVPFVAQWKKRIKPGRVVTDFISFADLAPTLLELAGVEIPDQITGKSFAKQLLALESGRIDASRNFTLLGKERHDIGRTDGDQLSVGYPVRAIRTDRFLYVRNFKPNRWPVGDPEYGFRNCDSSPSKSYLTSLTKDDKDYHFFEMAFGKRPAEELYDVVKDPDCVHNLAANPEFAKIKGALWKQLKSCLTEQKDPRILGQGDIFDYYPNSKIEKQRTLYGRPDYDPIKIFEEKYGSLKNRQ